MRKFLVGRDVRPREDPPLVPEVPPEQGNRCIPLDESSRPFRLPSGCTGTSPTILVVQPKSSAAGLVRRPCPCAVVEVSFTRKAPVFRRNRKNRLPNLECRFIETRGPGVDRHVRQRLTLPGRLTEPEPRFTRTNPPDCPAPEQSGTAMIFSASPVLPEPLEARLRCSRDRRDVILSSRRLLPS